MKSAKEVYKPRTANECTKVEKKNVKSACSGVFPCRCLSFNCNTKNKGKARDIF